MTDNNRTATATLPPVSRPTRAQRRALDARARVEAQRAADQIELERLEARREHQRVRAELAEQRRRLADEARQARRTAKAQARAHWRTAAAAAAVRLGRRIVLSGTNVGVNGVAVVGQVLALISVGWPLWAALLAAVVIESVAVYVGWHAHVALVEGDSAARLRLVSYGLGLAVAYLNYSHNDPRTAWLYAGCSAASPWLWAMHSRHVHRQRLRAGGLIDPRAPKFSALRWALHPVETAAALWWAVGEGAQSPAVAIAAVRGRRHAAAARAALDEGQTALQAAAAAAVQLAVELLDRGSAATAAQKEGDAAVAAYRTWAYSRAVAHRPPVAGRDQSQDRAATAPATGPATVIPAPRRRLVGRPGTPWPIGELVPFEIPSRLAPRPDRDRILPPPAVVEPDAAPVTGDDQDATGATTEPRPGGDRKPPTEQDNRRARQSLTTRVKRWRKPLPSKSEFATANGFSEGWAWNRLQEVRQSLADEGWTFAADGTPVPPPVAEPVVNGASISGHTGMRGEE